MACVGHELLARGLDFTIRQVTPPCNAVFLASWIRCTQRLHFSITPRERTATFRVQHMRRSGSPC